MEMKRPGLFCPGRGLCAPVRGGDRGRDAIGKRSDRVALNEFGRKQGALGKGGIAADAFDEDAGGHDAHFDGTEYPVSFGIEGRISDGYYEGRLILRL